MDPLHRVFENWHSFLGDIGIVAGLIFTTISLRSETRMRKISNLLEITKNHREIWQVLYEHPELERVLDWEADLIKLPITIRERILVNSVILHLSSVFEARKRGLTITETGMEEDVREFFSSPIPEAIWDEMRRFHDTAFVVFVEECRNTGKKLPKVDSNSEARRDLF